MGQATIKKGAGKYQKSKKGATTVRGKSPELEKRKKSACVNCTKDLNAQKVEAFFVEEEIGRVFCSESCIVDYFSPDIKRLEKEYFSRLSTEDLSSKDRKKLSEHRWATLKRPDEVWRQKTLAGDYRFTLISEFKHEQKPIWCICICLFLKGEPSFLYLAFPTKNTEMVAFYRRGERVQLPSVETSQPVLGEGAIHGDDLVPMDGLGSDWTEEEILRAQLAGERSLNDIPASDFQLYQTCVSETLDLPDEVWSLQFKNSAKLIHFMRCYPEENPLLWYIVVARETEDEDGIEILDAFPTRDQNLVDRFRKGEQQVGATSAQLVTRTVH